VVVAGICRLGKKPREILIRTPEPTSTGPVCHLASTDGDTNDETLEIVEGPPSNIEFLVPWHAAGSKAARFERELASEIGPAHVLNGIPMRAVAVRQDRDDVLFVGDDERPVTAVVHLTYSNRPEPDPRWPTTTLFDSLEDWVERGMRADHDDFCS
jgi:hypothetical protein